MQGQISQLSAGSVFAGEFRVERALSAGGMGAVYVVEQLKTGRKRALKLMHPQLAADARFRERFEREARIAATIGSEHVVEVVDAGVDEATGMPWIAMELLAGRDLNEMVTDEGPLPTDRILAVFEELCHALSAAHEAGVVHRDLKPDNIFLARTRRAGAGTTVKVLDFGIAKLVATAQTKGTGVIGTPLWMAPEQTIPDGKISRATDVWPLGLIAFFLLTGTSYWKSAHHDNASPMTLLREVAFEPLVPAGERARELGCAALPDGFDGWFARCVARDVAARFATVEEAYAALVRVLAGRSPAKTRDGRVSGGLAVGKTAIAAPATPAAQKTIPEAPVLASEPASLAGGEPGTFEPMADSTPGMNRRAFVERSRWPLVAAALALAGVAGAFAFSWSGPPAIPTVPHAARSAHAASQALLDEADSQRKQGNHELAHKLIGRLPEDSPLRTSDAFRRVEDDWARHILERHSAADTDEAVAKLNEVARTGAVSANLRQLATSRLQARQEAAKLDPQGDDPIVPGDPAAGQPPDRPITPPAPPTPSPTATPPRPGSDPARQKAALYAKMIAGTASEHELRLLRAICSTDGDRACRNMAHAKLKELRKPIESGHHGKKHKQERKRKYMPDDI